MLSSRFVPGQSNAMRKSRLEGKPSMLPKPMRPGSTDRLSTEARRPSTTGLRSSSADPRGTFGANRLSREASATKSHMSARSKSQQAERYAQGAMTPLRTSHYSRPTTTPVRTPSEDRAIRSWQTSLDRALAFVTIKDQRPVSNAGWQRAECTRVQEALSRRSGVADGNNMVLIRPLTIARFVDITGGLLALIMRDTKLNNDNYVTKLPHLSKRLLYPGAVSKSWLKTVNTLHAFPHALALIAYLLDIANHIEMPVLDEELYVEKGDVARLRRDYLYKCWIRFQDPGHQFEDLNEEYLQSLQLLLGNDDEKIMELQQIIAKYESCLEDEVEVAARAEEARLAARRDALLSALRSMRAERVSARAAVASLGTERDDLELALRQLDQDIERATAESQQLRKELEEQPLTVADRARLLDEVDYALRVQDSKRALAHQIDKMLLSKETELALWQKKTLDSCVEYKQGLIHLSAQFPDLAAFAIDEKELMDPECAKCVLRAVEQLRSHAAALAGRHAATQRARSKLQRQRHLLTEETRTKILELKSQIQQEHSAFEAELASETTEASAWTTQHRELVGKVDAIRAAQVDYLTVDNELVLWEKQDAEWQGKLSAMREYIEDQREQSRRLIEAARLRRAKLLLDTMNTWSQAIQE